MGPARAPEATSTTDRALLAVLLVGAWVLRASVFFRPGGVVSWPIDYDEGVYVAAAGLLRQGLLPYRDFAFLHPPGVLLALLPFTALGPLGALTAARVVMSVVGTVNVWLVYENVRRASSPAAPLAGALVAGLLYTCWPEAVWSERRVLLEPLVTACALTATLHADRPRLGGLALGAALGLKSWAVFWVAGLLAAGRWRTVLVGLGVAAALGSLALASPGAAFEQLVLVHLTRPPDGDLERLGRLREMFLERNPLHLLAVVLAAPGLLVSWRQGATRTFTVTLGALLAAFLAAAAWWNQYDGALAAVVAPLVGLGVARWWPTRWSAPVAFAVGLALTGPGLVSLLRQRKEGAPQQLAAAAAVAARVGPGERACAFEAMDLLLADRWAAPPVDSYGQQLVDARAGGRFASCGEAFASSASQRTVRAQLDRCEVLLLGWRGEWQLDATSKAWVGASFVADGPVLRRAH